MLQGLALGGEYGGAAVYVAEQAPDDLRGFYTSWIQATSTLGLLLSLVVILCCRAWTGAMFDQWGWRIPFWFSAVLLGLSLWIRASMGESRAFIAAKQRGKLSRAPLREVFGTGENVRKVLLAFGGLVSGMTVVWYTSTFYALFFLTQSLRMDAVTANLLLGTALLFGSPLFVAAGRLSDRVGRKPVILAGMLAAALLLIPVFWGLAYYGNPRLVEAARTNPVVVAADPATCSFQFDPVGKGKSVSACDKAKALLSKGGVPYTNSSLPAGSGVEISVGRKIITGFESNAIQAALTAAGYPSRADPAQINAGMVLAMLVVLTGLASLVYGPLAAALVEMFPTRIRYTALSVPYHAGVGWIGGLLPAIAFSLVVATGDTYYGLRFPVLVASLSFLVGVCFVPETRGRDLHAD
jgi:MFS family permease